MNVILLLSLLTLSLGEELATCSNSNIPGPIIWTKGSTSTTSYIIQAGGVKKWGTVTTNGNIVTSNLGPRYYLANSCNNFSPTVFKIIYLLGATISFTVDLSTVGCGQNAAFYLVSMTTSPGSSGDYYCDANSNCIGGACCEEIDLLQANRHALQITLHKCYDSYCDQRGCLRNSRSIPNGYGPGSSYTINTQNPFTVSITFKLICGQISSIESVISQGSKNIKFTHDSSCGSSYLQSMADTIRDGLVPVWSFSSGDMTWLDSPACYSEDSNKSIASFKFSNLVVTNDENPITITCGCGNINCLIEDYYVEFTSTKITSNPAYVLCNGNVKCSCYYNGKNIKWQCNCPNRCVSPVPYVDGLRCPFMVGAVLGEEEAQNSGSLNSVTVTMITVGCVLSALLIIVVIVIVVMKKTKKTEENVFQLF